LFLIVIQLASCFGRHLMAVFGDIRVADRADWFLSRIVATGSLVLKRLGGNRAGEIAVQRLLASPHVSVAAVIDTVCARTAQACAGRQIVCAQDTSEINFKGRDAARHGLGPGGDGETAAFFVHPLVAIDAASGSVLGLAGAGLWTRDAERTPHQRTPHHRGRPPLAKESRRWLAGANRADAVFGDLAGVTVVADRESDIYHLFAHKPERVELIVRAAQNRALEDGEALFEAVASAPCIKTGSVVVPPRGPGDKGRTATVELRALRVNLARPHTLSRQDAPDIIAMTIVEAREINPPHGVTPLLWRLLSSADREACEIVRLYRLRWRIEEVFRSLKSGLGLPDTQIHGAGRILLLAAFALAAAVRIIQLVDARNGSDRPVTDAIDAAFTPALIAISRTLERPTLRQQNPHPPESLAFLAWIAARLGGWNCYGKPPGPKTIATGWNVLAQQLQGYAIANNMKNA
jgi:Transposase DDE domain